MTLAARYDRLYARSRAQPEVPWEVRKDRLERLRLLVSHNKNDIAAAISDDFGNRSQHETQFLECFTSLQAIDHALAHGKQWMQPHTRPTAARYLPAVNRLLPQPLGVIGIVSPWNYPLLLTVGPLAGALAAGNVAMVKLSEHTPVFGELFARLIHQTFSGDEIAVVNGDMDIASAFCTLAFDHLLFTGSTATGREVMRIAAERLTPVTLELGGKSPAIITAGAGLAQAVMRIMRGKLLNAGQTCIAPDYVLLPRGSEQAFINTAREAVARLYPSLNDERFPTDDYTSIVNQHHFTRLLSLLDDARQRGALITPLTSHAPHLSTRLLPPVVLTQVPADADIHREEIFGPLLPLISYDKLDDAIAFINARPRPLALYLFAREQTVIDQVLRQTVSGGVTVNDTLLHVAQEELPFGGVGDSGMGAYHGEEGFRRFSHMKPVFIQSRINVMRLFYPPYGRVFSLLMKLLTR